MPTFEAELSDGRIVTLEADSQPTEQDILAAIGNQKPSAADALNQRTIGPFQAFAFEAAKGVAPTIGSAIGAGTGAAYGSELGPWGALGGGIVGALAGGWAGGEAQDQILKSYEPEFAKQVNELDIAARTQHPIASALGTLAAGVTGFQLNPGQTFRGLRALPAFLSRTASPAEQTAAKTLAAQVGVGAGIGAVNPLLHGQIPTATDVLTGAAYPLVFGQPRFGVGEPMPTRGPRVDTEGAWREWSPPAEVTPAEMQKLLLGLKIRRQQMRQQDGTTREQMDRINAWIQAVENGMRKRKVEPQPEPATEAAPSTSTGEVVPESMQLTVGQRALPEPPGDLPSVLIEPATPSALPAPTPTSVTTALQAEMDAENAALEDALSKQSETVPSIDTLTGIQETVTPEGPTPIDQAIAERKSPTATTGEIPEAKAKEPWQMTPEEAANAGISYQDYTQSRDDALRSNKLTEKEWSETSFDKRPDLTPSNWPSVKVGQKVWDDWNRKRAVVEEVGIGKVKIRNQSGSYWMSHDRVFDETAYVQSRIREGKPIPPEALSDYPDLQRKTSPVAQGKSEPEVPPNPESINVFWDDAVKGFTATKFDEKFGNFHGTGATKEEAIAALNKHIDEAHKHGTWRSVEHPQRKPSTADTGKVLPTEATAKQPWEMTRQEYRDKEASNFESLSTMTEGKDITGMPVKKAGEHQKWQQEQKQMAVETRAGKNQTVDAVHKMLVMRAKEKGAKIPTEVLADYPDLQRKTPPATQGESASAKPPTTATVSQAEGGVAASPAPSALPDISTAKGEKQGVKKSQELQQQYIQSERDLTAAMEALLKAAKRYEEWSAERGGGRPELVLKKALKSTRVSREIKDRYESAKLTRDKLMRETENAMASERDEAQTEITNRISEGKPVTGAELKEYFQPDSDWVRIAREKGLVKPQQPPPTETAGEKKQTGEMRPGAKKVNPSPQALGIIPPGTPNLEAIRMAAEQAFEQAKVKLKNTRATLRSYSTSKPLRELATYTKDVASNQAHLAAKQLSNDLRGSVRRALNRPLPPAPIGNARTEWERQQDMDQAALNIVVESGRDLNQVQHFENLVRSSTAANRFWKEYYLRAIEHARANWAELQAPAQQYAAYMHQEWQNEIAHGIEVIWRDNYVPHAQDLPNEFGFLGDPSGEGTSGFRHARAFRNNAESIAAGVDPITLNAADVAQARIASGQMLINNREWLNIFKRTQFNGRPIVGEFEVVHRRPPLPSDRRTPAGYTNVQIGVQHIPILDEFANLFQALSQPSWFRGHFGWNVLLKAAAGGKHFTLMLDTFHLGRIAAWEMAIKPLSFTELGEGVAKALQGDFNAIKKLLPIPSYEKGGLMVDYSANELTNMAARGEIDPSILPELLAAKSDLQRLIWAGYNIGKITDVLHQHWVQAIPVTGRFNKWLFDQFVRGAMVEVGLMELQRYRRMYPNLSHEEIARRVAKDLNVRFGNLGRQGILKSRTMQDIGAMLFLAQQWNEALIRSETGAVTGALRGVKDTVKNRRLQFGVLPRATGAMAVGIFLMGQIINYITRGKPTWENPEEGAFGPKISGYIPDVVGGGPGFFLNPMSLPLEITHLLAGKYENTKSYRNAVLSYLGSRQSTLMRPGTLAITGKDAMGRSIPPDDLAWETFKQSIPLPIGGSAAWQAGQELVSDDSQELYQGQYQKQLMASIGMKTDQAPSPERRIQNLAREFNRKHDIQPSAEFYTGTYSKMISALRIGNTTQAIKEYQDILGRKVNKKTPEDVVKHMLAWPNHPYTGNSERESEMYEGLSDEQKATYAKARQDRVDLVQRFFQMLDKLAVETEGK